MPRRTQRRVDHHGHERAVQTVLLRQAGEPRVRHALRHDERRDRGPREHVEEQVGAQRVPAEPPDAGEDGRGVVERAVGGLDARGAVVVVVDDFFGGGGRAGEREVAVVVVVRVLI